MSSEPVLDVRGLKAHLKLHGKAWPCVNGVSFQLYPGKTLALVGESGCGKTMTALSLLSLALSPPALPPEGEVLFQGKNLLRLSPKELRQVRGGKISMIFQDPSSALNPLYTVGNQLIETVHTHLDLSDDEAYAKAVQALESVGIPDPKARMEEYPHQFSGGMRQRAMIAMALLTEPQILIADEPTTALDVTIQAQVLDLLKALQKKNGMAILLITHDLGVVAEMADEVAVMYATEIVEKGSVDSIFNAPSHPYTQELFRAFSRKKNQEGRLFAIKGTVPELQRLPSGCKFHPRCPHAFAPCFQGEVHDFHAKDALDHTFRCWLGEKS
jgi:peptide/nickel transport system ATP-binding protein